MKRKSRKHKNELRAGRVVVNLNREEFEFIDKIGRDALFTTGKRLTNNKILRAFVNVIRELKIDGSGLHSCEELKERIFVALGIKRERRMYPRFKEEIKVCWRKLDSMSRYESVKTTEISEDGFRIDLNRKRNPGDILEFIVIDPSLPDNPIKMLGRVAWIERRANNNHETGIHLIHVPAKDKDRFMGLFYEDLTATHP